MNIKKLAETRIRGWLPKDPSFTISQKTKMVEVNQKIKKTIVTRYALTCIFVFAVVFGTLSILEVLGLGSYVPFAAGAVGALASVVSSVLLWKPRNQSSKHSELKNRPMAEGIRKASKIISVANAVYV
jgi:Na+/proline symporter